MQFIHYGWYRVAASMSCCALLSCAQTALAEEPAPGADAVVVSATRRDQPSLLLPAAVDRLYSDEIRFGRPQINLSESIGRVPGIVVQNRNNYTQDLQVHSRGVGARSTFGIRGLRLYQDGIPASMPDGQGQASSFDLGSAERIEVLRGALAPLYGNSGGGVINIITEDGPARPEVRGDMWAGSFGTRRWLTKAGGESGPFNYTASLGDFWTDGWREHSAASRQQVNAKVRYALNADTGITLLLNSVNQPESQDPLGMTRSTMNTNRRSVETVANTYNTRKGLGQDQAGLSLSRAMDDGASLVASAYAGRRNVRQYLSIPYSTQSSNTHGGGVVDLGRDFGGASLRYARPVSVAGMPSTLTLGTEIEGQRERRTGYMNVYGVQGSLKRDEDDSVVSTGAYALIETELSQQWLATLGGRTSRVAFTTEDFFIATGNSDDSGKRNYSAFTPSAGLLYRASPTVSVYGNLGRGFETPTFAELAYQTSGTGLNFALKPAQSLLAETGIKARLGENLRINAALFQNDTRDEIVIESNSGGRATYKNAGRARRQGVEFSAEARLLRGLDAYLAWTWVDARFRDDFTSVRNTPGVAVSINAGNRIPGIARGNLYGELRWRDRVSGFSATLEMQRKEQVMASDDNTESADGYTLANLVLGFSQGGSNWRISEFMRIDNLADKQYIGSVIVNDGNLRFFEPSPGRSVMLGVQASLSF